MDYKNYWDLEFDSSEIEFCKFDTIDSTNEYVKRCFPLGEKKLVVVADSQTDGKGRKGRSFYSPSDTGLYMSFGIRCFGEFCNVLKVTTAASVIIAKAIKSTVGVDVGIKWVNDIYYKKRKVCGILSECVIGQDSSYNIVVGIGVNLCTSDFPDDLSSKAASLLDDDLNIQVIKKEMIKFIVSELCRFFENPESFDYMEDYRKMSCILGKFVALKDAKGQFAEGIAVDFDDSGAIYLEKDGSVSKFNNGELSLNIVDL